jgi:protein-arginine kinase
LTNKDNEFELFLARFEALACEALLIEAFLIEPLLIRKAFPIKALLVETNELAIPVEINECN